MIWPGRESRRRRTRDVARRAQRTPTGTPRPSWSRTIAGTAVPTPHPPSRAVASRRLAVKAGSDLWWTLATAATAIALAAVVLRVWRGELDVPWWNGGDGLYELMRVKGVLDHGSLLSNPDLGAPFGQHLQDFPDSKPLQYVLIWMLGRGTSDPAVVGNVFFLLGFGLVATTAFVVLRWFGLSRAVCCACALLFSLSPYHFQHNEATLSLSAYYGVPLGAYLILAVLSGRRLFATVDGRHGAVRRWGSRISILTAAACVVIGLLDTYYAVFTIIVVIAATAVRCFATGSRRALVEGSVAAALVSGALLVALSPNLVDRAEPAATRSSPCAAHSRARSSASR